MEADDNKRLDLEFAYTPWSYSCRDLYALAEGSNDENIVEIACRRPLNHEGMCGSGFGSKRIRWQKRDVA